MRACGVFIRDRGDHHASVGWGNETTFLQFGPSKDVQFAGIVLNENRGTQSSLNAKVILILTLSHDVVRVSFSCHFTPYPSDQ